MSRQAGELSAAELQELQGLEVELSVLEDVLSGGSASLLQNPEAVAKEVAAAKARIADLQKRQEQDASP